ncbi:MAG: hypothetical protein FWG69_05030 [Oscillospiraceae bacterium]|nr:hypothetical protein [Oscillospiraceae bacterium]
MKNIQNFIISVLLIAIVFSGTAAGAATTNLPSGLLIGDQDGISVGEDGKYFFDADSLEAGDVITKQLTILNTETYAWKLTMTAEPLNETGPLKLLDEVRCILKMDGKILYDGRIRGDEGIDMILNSLNLGVFHSGDQRMLEITLKVNPDMKRYHWTASKSFFKWKFYAVRAASPEDGPKTGEIIKISLCIILSGILLAAGILFWCKRRHRRKNHTEMI